MSLYLQFLVLFFFLQYTRKKREQEVAVARHEEREQRGVHGAPPRKPPPSLTPQQINDWSPKANVRVVARKNTVDRDFGYP